jgi:hypothetical protein
MLTPIGYSQNKFRKRQLLVSIGILFLGLILAGSLIDGKADIISSTAIINADDFDIPQTIQNAELSLADYFDGDAGIPQGILESTQCVLLFPYIEYEVRSTTPLPGLGIISCREADDNWAFEQMVELENAKLNAKQSDNIDSLLLLFSDLSVIDKVIRGKAFKLSPDKAALGPISEKQRASKNDSREQKKVSLSPLIYYGATVDTFKRFSIESILLTRYAESNAISTSYSAELSGWHSALRQRFSKSLVSKVVVLSNGW